MGKIKIKIMETLKQIIAALNMLFAVAMFIWILLDLVETEFDEKSIMKSVAMVFSIVIFVIFI